MFCKKHGQSVTFICTKPNCSFGNFVCQSCTLSAPQHRNEHKNFLHALQDFNASQNGHTRTRFLPQLEEMANDLDRKLSDFNLLLEKDVKEMESDSQQLFKIFFDICERSKQQIKDLIKKDFTEAKNKLNQFRQQLNEYHQNNSKKDSTNKLFQQLFSSNAEQALPVNDVSFMQIINANAPLNCLRNDLLTTIYGVINSIQNPKPHYKVASNHQQIFATLKQDLHQTLTCLFAKMADFTNENQTVEDMKRSIYQFSSTDGSMRQSVLSNSSRFGRSSSIVMFRSLEQFPPLPTSVMQVLQQVGNILPPGNENTLTGLEEVGPCIFPDGIIYQGQTLTNQRHGFGRAKIGSDYYEGYWRENMPFGFGRIISANGDYYEGQSQNGKASGKGIFVSGPYRYDGEWQEDMKHGRGLEVLQGKFIYEGGFQENKKQGSGKLTDLQTGTVYVGDFEDGVLVGQATIKYQNGDQYLGQVITLEGVVKRHGRGVYVWVDGRKYEGCYEYDREHGEGIFIWQDNWIYKGQWVQGKQHGRGMQVTPQGKEKEGIWLEGQFKNWVS